MSAEKTVGKSDLIDAAAKKTGLTKAQCKLALDSYIDQIQSGVAKGKHVCITGFGSFSPRKRAARMGRNPSNGAPLKIKASVAPAFKAGAGFKAAVAKK